MCVGVCVCMYLYTDVGVAAKHKTQCHACKHIICMLASVVRTVHIRSIICIMLNKCMHVEITQMHIIYNTVCTHKCTYTYSQANINYKTNLYVYAAIYYPLHTQTDTAFVQTHTHTHTYINEL